jgi:hypothetical protein
MFTRVAIQIPQIPQSRRAPFAALPPPAAMAMAGEGGHHWAPRLPVSSAGESPPRWPSGATMAPLQAKDLWRPAGLRRDVAGAQRDRGHAGTARDEDRESRESAGAAWAPSSPGTRRTWTIRQVPTISRASASSVSPFPRGRLTVASSFRIASPMICSTWRRWLGGAAGIGGSASPACTAAPICARWLRRSRNRRCLSAFDSGIVGPLGNVTYAWLRNQSQRRRQP